jgi:uncharacterized protein (TIGR03083 family)
VITAEADRLAEVLAGCAPDAPVPTCPEWTAIDLAWHLTEVHGFWAAVLGQTALSAADIERIEADKPARPETLADVLAMRAEATAELVAQLTVLDDAERRWSWWDADQTVGFTRRMQTYEATMHRIDAELAAGVPPSPIEAEVAAGAVDHCVDVMWAWMPDWAEFRSDATVDLVASDTGQRWQVEFGRWTGVGPESGTTFDEPRAVRSTVDSSAPVTSGLGTSGATVAAPVVTLATWAWRRGGDVTIDGGAGALRAVERQIANGIQ